MARATILTLILYIKHDYTPSIPPFYGRRMARPCLCGLFRHKNDLRGEFVTLLIEGQQFGGVTLHTLDL